MATQHTSERSSTMGSISVAQQWLRPTFLVGIWLFVVGLLFQLFTVGMAVFVDPSWWTHHVLFSYVIGTLAFILLLIALFGRFPKEIWSLTGLINILFFVQGSSANLSLISPALSLGTAFHPVNALLLFWAAIAIAQKTQRMVMGSKQNHT